MHELGSRDFGAQAIASQAGSQVTPIMFPGHFHKPDPAKMSSSEASSESKPQEATVECFSDLPTPQRKKICAPRTVLQEKYRALTAAECIRFG